MSFVQINEVETFYANIHVAGDYDVARSACREIAYGFGFCFQLHKVDYVYSGGEESGLLIRVINYPRFPRTPEEITKLTVEFAKIIADKLCQKSFTVETKTDTMYFESDKHTK